MTHTITIRKYRREDESGWVRCRVLSLLDTPYYDDVQPQKPQFDTPAIEIVADYGGQIVGVLDIQCDSNERSICYRNETPGGIIRTLAVLPEFRREKVAVHLLKYACDLLREAGIGHLEAWVREDAGAEAFFQCQGFSTSYSYLHFYADGSHCRDFGQCRILDCFVLSLYGEYTGSEPDLIRASADRAYTCALYERPLDL